MKINVKDYICKESVRGMKYNILPMQSIIEKCPWSFAESHFAGINHAPRI